MSSLRVISRRAALALAVTLPALWLIGLLGGLGGAPDATAASVRYVKRDASPPHTGLTWENAFTNPQRAIDASAPGDEIWVARGVYTPTKRTHPGDPRTATFQLKEGVALYGGFAGTETQRSQRTWTANVTVLSGDLDNNDMRDANGVVTTALAITGNNAYHVVTATHVTSRTVLDGFTITAGSATEDGAHSYGGGMLNQSNASPTVRHVAFRGNLAFLGGGMANEDRSSPALSACSFNGNMAVVGGGVYDDNGSSPTLTDVTFTANGVIEVGGGLYHSSAAGLSLRRVAFSGNWAGIYGGGMATYNGDQLALADVTFSGNLAGAAGGGMFNYDSDQLVLADVTFSGNLAGDEGGGGLLNYESDHLALVDVTFSGNRADGDGGGMLIYSSTSPSLVNVTLRGNQSGGDGGGMANYRSNPHLVNVLFAGNYAARGGGIANSASSPRLVNVTLGGNRADQKGGGAYQANGSRPVLVNCILWGNTAPSGAQYHLEATTALTVTYTDVQGGLPGTGNLDADPRFVAPVAATLAPTTTGNYRLQAGSPVIDKGNNAAIVTPTTDLDGQPRIVGGRVDMGAYERQRTQVYLPVVRR